MLPRSLQQRKEKIIQMPLQFSVSNRFQEVKTSTTESSTNPKIKKRRVHVNAISQRYKAALCMIDHAEANREKTYRIEVFYGVSAFIPGNEKENLQKASLWWSKRTDKMSLKAGSRLSGLFAMTSSGKGGRRVEFKAVPGRGQKQ